MADATLSLGTELSVLRSEARKDLKTAGRRVNGNPRNGPRPP